MVTREIVPVSVPMVVLRMGQTMELRGRLTIMLHGMNLSMTVPIVVLKNGKVRLKPPLRPVTPWTTVPTPDKRVEQFRPSITPGIPSNPGGVVWVGCTTYLAVHKAAIWQ